MVVCGVSLSASDAILVWLESSTGAPIVGASARVTLADPYSKQDLSQTSEVLRQLLAERKTELVVVKKASTSGKYPAGHVSFRVETLVTLVAQCDVVYVAPQSVSTFEKKQQPNIPASLKKYQVDAYLAGLSVL